MLIIEHKKDGAMFCYVSQERIPNKFLAKIRSLANSEVKLHVKSHFRCAADKFTGLSSEGDHAGKTYSNEFFNMCSLVELTLPKKWLYQAAGI